MLSGDVQIEFYQGMKHKAPRTVRGYGATDIHTVSFKLDAHLLKLIR